MKSIELSEILGIASLDADMKAVEKLMQAQAESSAAGLAAPIQRLIKSGGKRLRAALVIAAAGGPGEATQDTIAAAAAIELVHLGTLVHDDIIDQAATRRGVATISAQEGISHAVLAGDFLLARAGVLAATVGREAAVLVSTTVADLCSGQSLELADDYNPQRSSANYLLTIDGKTAALLGASARLGGLVAGRPVAHLDALESFGHDFGMAFQLADDVLDFIATGDSTGKPVGADLRAGVYTLPIILALHGPEAPAVRAWLGRSPQRRPAHSEVVRTLKDCGAFSECLAQAHRYNLSATQALDALPDLANVPGLRRLPAAYLSWVASGQSALPEAASWYDSARKP